VRAALPSFAFRVTFHAAFREVNLAAPDPIARLRDVARVQRQMELARGLGAEAIVVHPGARIRGLRDADAQTRCEASLRALAAAARELALDLRVENMPRGPVELAQDAAALRPLAEVAGGACWDAGHARTFAPAQDPAAVADLVREVHLHDNGGRSDDHRPVARDAAWVAPLLRRLEGPRLLVVVEHRTLAECLAARDAARVLLG
jgi:sugar phosphate isomerase/epimerase